MSSEKYFETPTSIIPETVRTINVIDAAIVPHLEIKPLKLSNAMSRAVLGASSVCIFTNVSPLTVFTPTSVTIIFPSPDITVVPANKQF